MEDNNIHSDFYHYSNKTTPFTAKGRVLRIRLKNGKFAKAKVEVK